MKRYAYVALALVLVSGVALAGCGASTSSAEAGAISEIEERFLLQWERANEEGRSRCAGQYGSAWLRCRRVVVLPAQREAAVTFSDSLSEIVDEGVGSECAAAVEEARRSVTAVPRFPGRAAAVCRGETDD